jgi:Flp pilus assembly pilin Flp
LVPARLFGTDIFCVGWQRLVTLGHRLWARGSQPQITEIDLQGKEVKIRMLITYFQSLLAQLTRNEEGQTAVEYGLVVALVSLIIVGALATGMGTVITNVVANLTAAL